MNKEIEEQDTGYAWDFCIGHEIASKQELDLVTKINGLSWVTIMSVIYVRTGYRDIAQYVECEGEGTCLA